MPGTQINGSSNIAFLDTRVQGNLCTGNLSVDVSPSTFIGSGATSILGIKVQIKNPQGAIIKAFGGSFDVTPGSTSGIVTPVTLAIPIKGTEYVFGIYTIDVQMTDEGGVVLPVVSKTINLCKYVDNSSNCEDSVTFQANCQAGQLTILMKDPANYQGRIFKSTTQNWVLNFPTDTGMSAVTSAFNNFSVQLFEGVYKLVGSICAMYDFGDNVFAYISYGGTFTKDVKCILDYSCIYPQIDKLRRTLNDDCSAEQKANTANIILETLFLMTSINITLTSGEDASDQIADLEKLLGCKCTCDCNGSTPVINNNPATNIQINGCDVDKSVVGLTTVYTINNYQYITTFDPTQNIISVSAPELTDCTYTQEISINLSNLVAYINNQIATNPGQANFYTQLINQVANTVNAAALGYNTAAWQALTLAQKLQVIVDNLSSGGMCSGSVSGISVTKSGSNAIVNFTAANCFTVEIYVDGVMQGIVFPTLTSFTLEDFADGTLHSVNIVPRCTNGVIGVQSITTFQFIACPHIEPISVSSNNITNATCPYSLTSLVAGLPAGISAEWHTANNTDASTIVGNPAAVASGIYYGWAKNTATGCYSDISVQVTVACDTAMSTCSAPQNLTAASVGGGVLVSFDSAAFPPPANSYTVKRRLSSDPDVSGSYTTIGPPAFNSTSGRWEILDSSGMSVATLYSYQAISNCSSSSPSIQIQFGIAACPTITKTVSFDRVNFSIHPPVGGTTTYKFDLYNSSMSTLLQTVTLTGSFPSTLSSSFFYLTPGTNYNIQLSVYIGSYLANTCTPVNFSTTTVDNFTAYNSVSGASITAIKVSGVNVYNSVTSGALPLNNGQTLTGKFASFGGIIQITTTGSYTPSSALVYLDGVLQSCIDITNTGGTYSFPSSFYSSGQQLRIVIAPGACS